MGAISARRSRYKRQPSGKRIRVGDSDIAILAALHRFRYLTSKDLVAYIKPKSGKRFVERLGDLFHDAVLVDRPQSQSLHQGISFIPMVYALSRRGYWLLKENNQLPKRAVMQTIPNAQSPQFAHALAISQALCQAEFETHANEHQRFVPIEEIAERQRNKGKQFKLEFSATIPRSQYNSDGPLKTKVRPDGLYGIEYTETGKPLYRFFAIEVERTSPKRRSSLKLSSTLKKQLAYEVAIKTGSYKDVLGVPNLTLQIVSQR